MTLITTAAQLLAAMRLHPAGTTFWVEAPGTQRLARCAQCVAAHDEAAVTASVAGGVSIRPAVATCIYHPA